MILWYENEHKQVPGKDHKAQPFHPGPTCAASALSMGTRLGPVRAGGGLPVTLERENGFGGAFTDFFSGAACAVLVVLAAPDDSFARFTFSFSSATAGRVRDTGTGSALAFPFSFAVSFVTGPVVLDFTFACAFLSRSGFSSSSVIPNSAARLLCGGIAGIGVDTVGAGVGEPSESSSASSVSASRSGRSMFGLSGEFASMRILLRGLGFTGEYACLM